jgi:hypothetical protein
MALEYKFVELSIVTDETIEEAVNAWVGRGWHLDGIRFVATEASRRPQMAFISFTREIDPARRSESGGHERAPLTLSTDSGEHRDSSLDASDQTAPRPKGPRLVKADPEDSE